MQSRQQLHGSARSVALWPFHELTNLFRLKILVSVLVLPLLATIGCGGSDANTESGNNNNFGFAEECQTDNGGCGDPVFWQCTDIPGFPPTCKDIDECGLGASTQCTGFGGACHDI